ncbi:hypothetical protein [Azospirillum sp.]|uniref:hypothetical protein n=1 Tax=Azospirillum sp. TaxID=34012 RepID=UPI002D71BF60|nr:hypothetical protein [Azospirillum sp.]HYD69565.1 hypothetical protein [Azospirillum sp.]
MTPTRRAGQRGLGAALALAAATLLLLGACQTDSRQQVLATDKSQVELRAIQTRAFDTTDRNLTIRNVIASLQDLGFVIDKADEQLGIVSGTKLSGYAMRMTVTVRPRGKTQTAVRASAQYNLVAVSDAEPYQQFFAALSKAMFLTANEVD